MREIQYDDLLVVRCTAGEHGQQVPPIKGEFGNKGEKTKRERGETKPETSENYN